MGRQTILAEVRRAGQIARIDLVEQTGISAATVTAISGDLIRMGLIEEVPRPAEEKAARRGRPRVDLRILGAAHCVAGMKIGSHSISTVVVDFEGNVLAEALTPFPDETAEPDELAGQVEAVLGQVAQKAGISMSRLSGVGIGLSGFVDAMNGFVHWSPSLSHRNVAWRDMLVARLGLPVYLDNDTNLVAKAEQYFGLGRDVRDFIVLTVENGVGMGIVLDNQLYRGRRGCGAEFGHTKVQLDGALCRCGQRGCLEAYVADYALLREVAFRSTGKDSRPAAERLQALIDTARNDDPMARMITERAGKMFGLGLANIVNIFDPQLIILSGERMVSDYLFADEVIGQMRSLIVQVDAPPPDVVVHRWGDHMWARGAAAYAIEEVSRIAITGTVEADA